MQAGPVLILGGTDLELNGIRAVFRGNERQESGETTVERGILSGRDVILIRAGVGRVNAVSAAAWGLAMGDGAAAVIAVGFCSALDWELGYGSVLVPGGIDVEVDAVARRAGKPVPPPLRPDPGLASLAARHAERLGITVSSGELVTLDAPVTTLQHKSHLARITAAAAVDTETAGYGPAVTGYNAPLLALRIVVDGGNEQPLLSHALHPRKGGRIAQAVREVVSHVKELVGLPDPAQRTSGATQVLGELVTRVVGAL